MVKDENKKEEDVLSISMEHCYGIRNLRHDFRFDRKNKVNLIYAQNGVMKSSFARSFDDFSSGNEPEDRVYTEKSSVFNIEFNGKKVGQDEILVVDGMNKNESANDRMSTLLMNKNLRQRHDDIWRKVEGAVENVSKVIESANNKIKLEKIKIALVSDFGGDNYIESLSMMEYSEEEMLDETIMNLDYQLLFNDKTSKFLGTIKGELTEYIKIYNETLIIKPQTP